VFTPVEFNNKGIFGSIEINVHVNVMLGDFRVHYFNFFFDCIGGDIHSNSPLCAGIYSPGHVAAPATGLLQSAQLSGKKQYGALNFAAAETWDKTRSSDNG
jgi:hypothetical protein